MKLLLVRHGQSEKNVGLNQSGTNNLTNIGILEAKQLANFLLNQPISTIYSSAAPRAEQTLDAILANRTDGGTLSIHLTHFLSPKLKDESYDKVDTRIKIFLNDLLADHSPNETILIISHTQVLKSILKQLVKKDFAPDHASLTILEYSSKQSEIITLNQTSHLA